MNDTSTDNKKTATVDLPVIGMTCTNCSNAVERVLAKRTQGVKSAAVNLAAESATVVYDPDEITLEQMADAGIVGDYKGSQAREVLITPDQWRSIQAQAQADAEAGYEADLEDEQDADDAADWEAEAE